MRSNLCQNSNLLRTHKIHEELNVCFLAILELMKNGELEVTKEKESGKIFLNKLTYFKKMTMSFSH